MQGLEVHGVPEYVIVSGRVCVDECNVKAVHGFGKYLETPLYPLYVYDEVNEKEKVGLELEILILVLERRKSDRCF